MQDSVFGSAVLFLLTHKEHTLSHSHAASLARSLLLPFFSPFDFSLLSYPFFCACCFWCVSSHETHTHTLTGLLHTHIRSDTLRHSHVHLHTQTQRNRNTWILSFSFLFALLSPTRALTHRPKPGHTHIDTHTRALAPFLSSQKCDS